MEDSSAAVAPMLIHLKRDLPSHHYPHHLVRDWTPDAWDWDPRRFVATQNNNNNNLHRRPRDDDASSLRLHLGGGGGGNEGVVSSSRPPKRVCSGSPVVASAPAATGSYPMCQVDNCREDLSGAKDYHRRHKVCQLHSKSTQALVGSHLQRFCQQCSRFHLLSEFDEGKRSCRRRLAGHNRRRRKTHPDPPAAAANSRTGPAVPNLDVFNLLAAVARSQGKNTDKDQLVQILSSLPLPMDKTIPESTKDLLASLSGSPEESAKTGSAAAGGIGGGDRSSSSYQSPPNLPLQLFSSSPENEPVSTRNYFSSDSSNPNDDPSPSASPPVVQKLFPMQTMAETVKAPVNPTNNVNAINLNAHAFDLFRPSSSKPTESASIQSVPYKPGYTSSGSDHSPPSLNSDGHSDRTGRILFKLFDKDPSHFPGTLRTQIFNWLSHRPTEMESYIRPGCVVLSIYLSMPPTAWEQLHQNLLPLLSLLVQNSASDFWRSGRFLVHTGRQLASHKDGKFRLCKSWRTWSSPELISVSPLAVVGGKETSLVLRGRNLTSGTKIHCTYMGGYTTKEVRESTYQGTMYEEINLCGFKILDESPCILGRCFIEVENGMKGNSFPVIIADASICEELRVFESVLNGEDKVSDIVAEDQNHEDGRPRSKEEVLHFLNELGWLFQRKNAASLREGSGYSLGRFKFLLTFSIERNCCSLMKTLLDILVERSVDGNEVSTEAVEMLSEIQLLHRAVKRRSKKMVDLLINYSVTISGNVIHIFPPNQAGPGNITPLHLAASISGSEDVIDALINDPQQIGLNSWNSVLDSSGQTPYAYALMTNNELYNNLVARKLADRSNGQISVTIDNEVRSEFIRNRKSCARCAVSSTRYHKRVPGAQGVLQRPYIHSMLAIAAVCVCVCLFLRGLPDIGSVAPFKWENLGYGTI